MPQDAYFSPEIETMERSDLDALIDERVRYTVQYAAEHSPFYRNWFRENRIDPAKVRVHEDLLNLPVISGKTIRQHQPPVTPDFEFLSTDWNNVFSIQETSGTSGTPKGFFLTWDDWKRYAEKYDRSFVSQGFSDKDRLVVCASYGMNVGANTMTIAAQRIGMGIIPIGKCTFESRILKNYKPTAIVGSVFKLLRLARRPAIIMKALGIEPNYIPAKSGAERRTALAGGHIQVSVDTMASFRSFVDAKKIFVLAVTSNERVDMYKDIPTFKELGYDVIIMSWEGIFAPKQTPREVIKTLEMAFEKAARDKELIENFRNNLEAPDFMNAEALGAFLVRQDAKVKATVEDLGLMYKAGK